MGAPMAKLRGVLETSLYVGNLDRASRFYEDVMGLAPLVRDARMHAFDVGPASVLLLFERGTTSETIRLPAGEIPPHEGEGRLHFAFAADVSELPAWEARLAEKGVSIEARMTWPGGGKSLYFRDPDANLVEIATQGLWTNF